MFRRLKYPVTEVLKTDVFGDFWYSETLKNKSAYRDHSFRRLGFREPRIQETKVSGDLGFRKSRFLETFGIRRPRDTGNFVFLRTPQTSGFSHIWGEGAPPHGHPMKRCAGCYNLCMTTCLQLYEREVNVHCFIICLSISKFTFNLTPEIQSTL